MKNDKTTKFVKKVLNIFHIKVDKKTENLFVQIFKFVIVGGIATYVGAGLIVFGLPTLIISLKDDDPSGKYQAGLTLGIGLALVGGRAILSRVLGI